MNQKKANKSVSDIVYYVIRIAILISVIFLFIPNLNPARISGLINRNMSLFTSGLSYSSLTEGFGRAIKKEWVYPSTLQILYVSALATCLGLIATAASACMSVGNVKFKKLGNLIAVIGSAVEIGGMVGIYIAYNQISQTTKANKVEPMFSKGYWLIIAVAVLVLVLSIVQILLLAKTKAEEKFEMQTKFRLFLMYMPFLCLVAVFSYLPLLGWRYAFFDYKVGDTLSFEKFVGFKWFTELVKNPATVRDIVKVLKNTLGMSMIGIATSWLPMAFAIFLSEVKSVRFKRFVQTFTTIPNFISWVLVYSVAFSLFNSTGMMNTLLLNLGLIKEPVLFLQSSEHVWLTQWLWLTWKNLGWAAIMYIAAISSIDDELFQAAKVDGATRMQMIRYITIPSLLPTFFVLLMMNIGNFLSNGMEQYYVFQNAFNKESIQVLDLYVYNLAMGSGSYSVSVALSMLKSVVSVILLVGANAVSKLTRGESFL